MSEFEDTQIRQREGPEEGDDLTPFQRVQELAKAMSMHHHRAMISSMSTQFISTRIVRAKKQHDCIWCTEKIAVGEIHQREVLRFDGDFQNNRFHLECIDACHKHLKQSGDNEFEPHGCKRGSQEEA